MTTHAAAAKAIRNELKSIFPTVKFSVTSESFSMGNSVHISWVDGCTTEQVEKIVNKYQYGSFNSMEDLYESNNCRDDIPQTKYVQTHRGFSEGRKRETAAELGIDFDTEYNTLHESGDYNSARIRSKMWHTDYTNTPEIVEESAPVQSEAAPVEEKEKTFITVTFPRLNKNNSLAENFEMMVMYGMVEEKCRIRKTVELDSDEFETVANSLLENRSEMWEQIGGSSSDDPHFENVDSYEAFCVMMQNPATRKIYQDTCYTMVVEVIEKDGCVSGRKFYVNTEGYDYARYVGVVVPKR